MRTKVLIVAGLMLAVVALVFVTGRRPPSAPQTGVPSITNARPIKSTFKRTPQAFAGEIAEADSQGSSLNIFQRLSSGEMDLQLSAEQLAEYLRQYGTNVETLLATQNTNYIRLAAQLFPNDPRVQYAVVARNIFPEAKREWLDRFKKSDPDNALASYLSAREHLKAGDREQGLKDFAEAATRPRFNDYSLEQVQNMEDAHLSAGRSLVEAKLAAGNELLLPQLATFKNLAQEVQAMQKEYLAAGDTASAESLAQMGRVLSQQLISGEGSRPLISQLVGIAIERILISPFPAESQPAFLGGTVQQRIDEMNAFRQQIRTLTANFEPMMARGDANEIISYMDRIKSQGEYKAMLWLQNRNNLR
jgi:hypothetical protein